MRELYADFPCRIILAPRMINSKSEGRKAINEVLVLGGIKLWKRPLGKAGQRPCLPLCVGLRAAVRGNYRDSSGEARAIRPRLCPTGRFLPFLSRGQRGCMG